MRILVFLNSLSMGGTEKAACWWAVSLHRKGHEVFVLSLAEGPRRGDVERGNLPFQVCPPDPIRVRDVIRAWSPEVIHVHAPGTPHIGDLLGDALAGLPKIPVLQTNIFGRLINPSESRWVDFRAFISWTSCVQAARRSWQTLDERFFERHSVVGYPLDPEEPPAPEAIRRYRRQWGMDEDTVVFGRLSRPDPIKWEPALIPVWERVCRLHPESILLLREPPAAVSEALRRSPLAASYRILPVTADPEEWRMTRAALDGVIHLSRTGESFGYGIAEAMNLAKPVIANLTPWQDQAQVELVRHGECGYVCGTATALQRAILRLADSKAERDRMGQAARRRIRRLADPIESLRRLEALLAAVSQRQANPFTETDRIRAQEAADYLDRHQFGHSWREQVYLRGRYIRTRISEWRRNRCRG